MKNVLITGAGGAAVPALIKKLKNNGYTVTAVDMDKNAVGLIYADNSYIIPGGLDKSFLPVIEKICEKHKINAIIPLVDEELLKICSLESKNIKTILPNKNFVKLCLDKYTLMKELINNEIYAPKTFLSNEYTPQQMDFPIIIKPRSGRGSRGVSLIKNKTKLNVYLKNTSYKINDLIIQEYIEGSEFTVSVVVSKDGVTQAIVPKEIMSKQGITKLAVTRKNNAIDNICRKVQEILKANGPFNVQLILNKKDLNPYIFEINPRFSTSISLTAAAGIDEMIILLEQALFNNSPQIFNDWKENIVLVRENIDNFMDEQDYFNHLSRLNEVK